MIIENVRYYYVMTQLLEMLLDITKMVYTSIDLGNQGKTGEEKSKFKDDLNMAAFITDNGIVTLFTDILGITFAAEPAKINLGADGVVVINGANIKQISAGKVRAETLTTTIKFGFAIAKTVSSAVNAIADLSQMIISMQGVANAVETAENTQKDPSEEL